MRKRQTPLRGFLKSGDFSRLEKEATCERFWKLQAVRSALQQTEELAFEQSKKTLKEDELHECVELYRNFATWITPGQRGEMCFSSASDASNVLTSCIEKRENSMRQNVKSSHIIMY